MAVSAHKDWRKRLGPFLPVVILWLILVAVTSTSSAPAGVHRAWGDGLKRTIFSWTIWALLSPLIIKVDRWLPLSKESLFKRFLFHIPLSLIFTTVREFLYYAGISLLITPGGVLGSLRGSFKGLFQSNFLGYWIVLFVYFAFEYEKDLREQQLEALKLERVISESRLETLRAQLRPNFLFNALKAISVHVEQSPRIARRMLGELGELLRVSLAHSEEQEIPLAQEIGFLEQYLDIQKARFEHRLGATVHADPDVLDALVPTFILQPLVEAAIVSTSPDSPTGCVEVWAWRDKGQLCLSVQEDVPELTQAAHTGDAFGIGVSNTRERLRRMYGDANQRFEVSPQPGRGLLIDLSIPFREG